jgi:FixJ family two-component response regulator
MDTQALICVVDDDPDLRDSLTDLLRSAGYQAACFESAKSFLDSDERSRCGCVVADIQMPGLTGIELITHVTAATAAPKVLLITGHSEEVWRERALCAGAAGFLRKPIEAIKLLDLIERSTSA